MTTTKKHVFTIETENSLQRLKAALEQTKIEVGFIPMAKMFSTEDVRNLIEAVETARETLLAR